jgi:hypothetical protein
MNAVVAHARRPFQQDLRYYLPRWMAVFLAITLIQELTTPPPTGQVLWYVLGLVLIGLIEGAVGGFVFVGLQRMWNPRDSRVVRIRNYVAALVIVGVGGLFALTAIYR